MVAIFSPQRMRMSNKYRLAKGLTTKENSGSIVDVWLSWSWESEKKVLKKWPCGSQAQGMGQGGWKQETGQEGSVTLYLTQRMSLRMPGIGGHL